MNLETIEGLLQAFDDAIDKREKDLVMDYIRKEFAVIRRSFSVAVIPEFPRNDAGKILYGKLLERAKTLIAEQDSSMA